MGKYLDLIFRRSRIYYTNVALIVVNIGVVGGSYYITSNNGSKELSEWFPFIFSVLIVFFLDLIVVLFNSKAMKEGLYQLNYKVDKVYETASQAKNNIEVVANNVKVDLAVDEILNKVNQVEHEYFKRIIALKIHEFMGENASLFNGHHETNPKSPETFGAVGVDKTKKLLKCVSSISDYWDDRKAKGEYYYNQLRMIENRGVIIQRLFILPPASDSKERNKCLREMELQEQDGIKVRAVEVSAIEPKHRFRDYLIQDDSILVDLVKVDDDDKHYSRKEVITVNNVQARVSEFDSYWSHAASLENIDRCPPIKLSRDDVESLEEVAS